MFYTDLSHIKVVYQETSTRSSSRRCPFCNKTVINVADLYVQAVVLYQIKGIHVQAVVLYQQKGVQALN